MFCRQKTDINYLEVRIDNVKSLGVFRQLHSDVSTAHKNGLQRLPFLLDIQPGVQHHIHCSQLPLPVCDYLQELGIALNIPPCQTGPTAVQLLLAVCLPTFASSNPAKVSSNTYQSLR